MSNEQKRLILATVLSGLILFSWQYFFGAKIPEGGSLSKEDTTIEYENTKSKDDQLTAISKPENSITDKSITDFTLFTKEFSYNVSSNLIINNLKSLNSNYSFKSMAQKVQILFEQNGEYKPLFFEFEKVTEAKYKIENASLKLIGYLNIQKDGQLNLIFDSEMPFRYEILISTEAKELDGGKFNQFMYFDKDIETIKVGDEETGDSPIKWFGVDFDYHLLAFSLNNDGPSLFKTTSSSMKVFKAKAVKNANMNLALVKKEYDFLMALGNKLELSVDFGIWGILAVPILRGLQYIYSVLPNYGIAIILLTILMRLLTFPLQYKSYASMKKMQVVQPELAKIRERYKSDPQKMQQESMALFKKAGANPIGGCLPMLLQMPIFFAFYRVLYSAVELVNAPFYFWITDLSQKDPYYVLPVLMAAAMFFHQKLTPSTTMDPTQKKIMLFMPLIFAVFMKDFPAGLTLYIFVSTIFGMLQQLFVYKRV